MTHIDRIVTDAKSYLGQQEVSPNLSFKDPVFLKKMLAVGFYRTASWCGFFVMLVLFEVYKDKPDTLKLLKKLCSPSTHQMWLNFTASKAFETGSVAKLGAIAIWQEGEGINGHTGLVVSCTDTDFSTVEGNSNNDGSREGYEVAENKHKIDRPHSIKGLNLMGFVYMVE